MMVVALTALLLIAVLATTPAPLLAKGSSLETEELAYRPGQKAVARATFGTGYYDGTVSDGPYHSYLVPYEKPLVPGPLPPSAIHLGEIRMIAVGSALWRAVIEFRVPNVDPGLYRVDYCNVPCTVHGVGELESGSLQVLETKEAARLDRRQEKLQRRREDIQAIALASKAANANERQPTADLKGSEAAVKEASGSSLSVLTFVVAVVVLGVLLVAIDRKRDSGERNAAPRVP
jgi:hypothetical protein